MPLNKSKRNLIYTIVAIALGLSLGTLLYFYFFQASPQDPNLITYEETKYENISVYTQENILNEGRSLLHISYPVSENEAVNTVIEDIAEDFVAEFEEVAKSQEESYQAYKKETGLVAVSLVAEYIQHFDVSFASDKYLLFLIHQYRSTGGTGSDDVVSLLFDRQSGKQLSLSHLFSSDKYLEVLSEKSREVLEEKALSDAALSDFAHEAHYQEWVELTRAHIKNGTEPIKENFDSFDIVDNKDLHIIFDKYQVGPGSDGVISVAIPLS